MALLHLRAITIRSGVNLSYSGPLTALRRTAAIAGTAGTVPLPGGRRATPPDRRVPAGRLLSKGSIIPMLISTLGTRLRRSLPLLTAGTVVAVTGAVPLLAAGTA